MKQKYFFDFNFLDIIDTPEKAYFLGWAYSDGYNNHKDGSYKLSIQESDEEVLLNFKRILKSTYPINKKMLTCKNPNWKNQSIFYVYNRHFSNRLVELNVVPKKSKILSITPEIPENLMRYFLRGVFEGDGHFSFKESKTKRIRSVFQITTGSRVFATQLKEIIHRLTGEVISIYERGGNFWVKFSTSRKNYRFAKWLYQDRIDLSLSRKYNKILEFIKIYTPIYDSSFERIGSERIDQEKFEGVEELRLSGMTINQISNKIGVNSGSVHQWAKKNSNICDIRLWKKYTSNESFFDSLNRENLFVLGLIYGKGTITSNFNLKLSSKHLKHPFLEEIRKKLSSTRPIYNLKGMLQLNIASKKLYDRLVSLGVRNKKSDYILPNLSEDQLYFFLQGYLVANAKLYQSSRRREYRMNICSDNIEIKDILCSFMKEKFGIELSPKRPNKSFLFYISRRLQISTVINFLTDLPIKEFDYWGLDLSDMKN